MKNTSGSVRLLHCLFHHLNLLFFGSVLNLVLVQLNLEPLMDDMAV